MVRLSNWASDWAPWTTVILQEIIEGAAVCIRRANARTELRRARDEVGDSSGALHAARAVIAASAP